MHFDSSVMETADIDILWEARSRLTLAADIRGAGLIGLLRQADRSFEPAAARSFRPVNGTGFMVDLLKALPKDAIRDDARRSIGPTTTSLPCTSSGSPNSPTANRSRKDAIGLKGGRCCGSSSSAFPSIPSMRACSRACRSPRGRRNRRFRATFDAAT